jgi:RNA polymerase sigma-54 factor
LSQRLELRQSQSLVMTPQLRQAIRMLQLPNLDLAGFLQAEVEQNPLLEASDAGDDPPADEADGAPLDAAPAVADDAAEHWRMAAGAEGDGSADRGSDLAFWPAGGGSGHDGLSAIDQKPAPAQTLREHLLEQIGADVADPVDRAIALCLLEQLDEAGYLRGGPDEAAARLGCPMQRVERVLARLQEFDPPGVFARDIAECLALQLRDRDRLDPAMRRLLEHLPLLAARDLPGLIRVCEVNAADLADMVAEIRSLNPRPGHAFDPPLAAAIVPDVIMQARPDGGWSVELNDATLPRVLVNHRYYARVAGRARGKAERAYLADRLQAANWIVKSLHQRAVTILKVASEIVERQDGFFRHGVSGLRPLVLRDIGDALGMHESTVSRVTSNKYIATPRGLFELKYFFTAAIAAARGGEPHSAEAVRFRIRALIDGEPTNRVLSDQKLVKLLHAEGVEIARRTVTKYREAMRIPGSAQRHRDKVMPV